MNTAPINTAPINTASIKAMSGFLLTRQWLEEGGSQDLVFWLASNDGPVKLIMTDQTSVFFVKQQDIEFVVRQLRGIDRGIVGWHHAEVDLKHFDGEKVVACYFPCQGMLLKARSKLRQKISVFEADIRPTDRYLMERFITAGVAVEGIRTNEGGHLLFTDARIRKAEYVPELKVVSLDIETSFTENVLYSIAVLSGKERQVFMVANGDVSSSASAPYLEFCEDESAVIRHFLEWISAVDPDVLIGWNVVGFDLNFLQDRCDALAIPFTLGRSMAEVLWRTVSPRNTTVSEKRQALVPGRMVLDGIDLLRSATYQFESFSLEYVAQKILGRGKLVEDVDDRAGAIETLFKKDKAQLARYNLEDCKLVMEIFEATNLLNFAIEKSRLTGLDMDRMGGSVAAFDYLYLPKLHRKGFVAPLNELESVSPSPGGFVLESQPGIFDHVIVLDFKSLYPSIIRTFHVDPLAMAVGSDEVDGIPGFKGASFSRNQVILPKIIESLWLARDAAKHSANAAMSQAIKIIMNSFYGVLGTPGCRFFDSRLVSSITLRGHEILQKTRDLLEARGLRVIYGDTDSVFVLLKNVSSNEEASIVGRNESDYLNTWWREHLWQNYQLESCLEVEYETHFTRFLMPTIRGSERGSKKRYAGMVKHDKGFDLVFKGLETVRSDWSPLARDFQKALYEKIFLGEAFEEFIKETVASLLAGKCDHKLVLRKRLRRKLSDYQKNVPPHVKAARIAEEQRRALGFAPKIGGGGWIEYIMTVNGAEPRAYANGKIDYAFYLDKQLAPIADAILAFKSTSLAKITDQQLGLF